MLIITIFICQNTEQQGTKCTENCSTNKQNILDLQKQIANALFHYFISVLFFMCGFETVKQKKFISVLFQLL